MAIGPYGTTGADREAAVSRADLPADDLAFVRGLEKIIDRALLRHPRGDRFVYGIHQEIAPAAVEILRERYLEAGWSAVTLKPGATGAFLLILAP